MARTIANETREAREYRLAWGEKNEKKAGNAAVLRGKGEQLLSLVVEGSDAKQWGQWLRVPLEHALAAGNVTLAKELLDAGADGSAGCTGVRNRTLLLAAAKGGEAGAVGMILNAGAVPDVNERDVRSPFFSPLHYAAEGTDHDAVRLLLDSGASPDALSRNKLTPLHMAAAADNEASVLELIRRGADKNAVDLFNTHTPLLKALHEGACGAADALVRAKADVNVHAARRHGKTALHVAAEKNYVDIVRLLLQHNAKLDSEGAHVGTPLHLAAACGSTEVASCLVAAGANVRATDHNGSTPLHASTSNGHAAIARLLLDAGAHIDARNNEGVTPLHDCVSSPTCNGEDVLAVLLREGADENAEDNSGKTVTDYLHTENPGLRGWYRCDPPEEWAPYRARLSAMIARAPADRAWRRRGWLVMLRARVQDLGLRSTAEGILKDKEGVEEYVNSDGEADHSARIAPFRHFDAGRSEVRMSDRADVGSAEEGSDSAEEHGLLEVGAYTATLGQEGIFRSVVSFL